MFLNNNQINLDEFNYILRSDSQVNENIFRKQLIINTNDLNKQLTSGELEKNMVVKVEQLRDSYDPTAQKHEIYIYALYLILKEFLIGKNNLVKKGAGLFGFSRIKPSEQRISNKYFLDTDKLKDGILELRYKKNRHLTNVKSWFKNYITRCYI